MRPVVLSAALFALASAGPANAASHGWDGWSGLPPKVDVSRSGTIVQLSTPASDRVTLPGGSFIMGSTPTEMEIAVLMCRREVLRGECERVSPFFRAEGIAHDVTISPFALDRHEVTVAAYRRCVAAGVCGTPGFTPGDRRFDRDELPVVSVTWDDAVAFCRWSGARLPTEAESRLAARGSGGSFSAAGRLFPWGSTYNPHLANHGSFSRDETDASDGFRELAPVGSFPDGATPEGILDLAGNAAEWVNDLYDRDEEGFGYPPASAVDPKGSKNGVLHVVRGGSYTDGAAWLRSASRGVIVTARSPAVGFRCAADAGPRVPTTNSISPKKP